MFYLFTILAKRFYECEKLCVCIVNITVNYAASGVCAGVEVIRFHISDRIRNDIGQKVFSIFAGVTCDKHVIDSADIECNRFSDDVEHLDGVVILRELTLEGNLKECGSCCALSVEAESLESLSRTVVLERCRANTVGGILVTDSCVVSTLCVVERGSRKNRILNLGLLKLK